MSENTPKEETAPEAEDFDVVAHGADEEDNPGCIINHSSEL